MRFYGFSGYSYHRHPYWKSVHRLSKSATRLPWFTPVAYGNFRNMFFDHYSFSFVVLKLRYSIYSRHLQTPGWLIICILELVGGLEHVFLFPYIGVMSSSQLTVCPWFFRGVGEKPPTRERNMVTSRRIWTSHPTGCPKSMLQGWPLKCAKNMASTIYP